MTSARRRVVFFATGFFFAADFFFTGDFFFSSGFFFTVRFFGAALLTIFFLAEDALLAADFFRVGFFLLTGFFLRDVFFLAMAKVYQLISGSTMHDLFCSQILVYTADAKIPLPASINNSPPPMLIGFFVFWILLGIGGTVFYHTAPYKTKKFWHPFLTIGAGALFLAFGEFATNGEFPIFFILFLALITFLNIRNTRFCPKCNKTLYGRWSRDKFCPKCGAALDAENHDMNEPIGR